MYKQRPLRPVKFNVGMGIGKALEVGGQFYNDMAVELRNQQALEEARAFQTSERVAGQKFTKEMELERQQFQTGQTDIAYGRAQDDATLANTRQLERDEILKTNRREETDIAQENTLEVEGLKAKQVARVVSVPFKDITPEQQLAYANQNGLSTEELAEMSNSGQPFQVGVDANGELSTVLGADSDYIETADGWTLTTKASLSPSPKELESKSASQYVMFDQGMKDLTSVLETYDLTSGQALGDQVMTAGGTVGNWLLTQEGQEYRAAITRVNEALFKNLSGAAGSDAEAGRFERMLPAFGDTKRTIDIKLRALSRIANQMREAGFNGLEEGERAREAWAFTQTLVDSEYRNDLDNVFANTNLDEVNQILIPETAIDIGGNFSAYRDDAQPGGWRSYRANTPYAAGQD